MRSDAVLVENEFALSRYLSNLSQVPHVLEQNYEEYI
jgi:hypothetical protein